MVIVDESVSEEKLKKALTFIEEKYPDERKILKTQKMFPGMPDSEILKHLIDKKSILVTTDRVFHCKVLRKGFTSVYIDGNGEVTNKELEEIRLYNKIVKSRDNEIKEDYQVEKTEIHESLISESEIQLKKYKIRRRRIRNYFEGIDNINNIDVTLTKREKGSKVLIGMMIRVVGNNGMKALDASEHYILEGEKSLKNKEEIYFSYVLIILIRMMLNSKKITIFYDANEIKGNIENSSEYSKMYDKIKSYCINVELVAVKKGDKLEKLRRKLLQLIKSDSGNEIVEEEIRKMKIRMQI